MEFSPAFRIGLRICMWIGLALLYIPLALIVVNSFNASRTFAFPPTGFTLEWWVAASHSSGALRALGTSIVAGVGATVIALILGTMAAFAVQRYRFFGRNTISFLVVLPITLPGIVTGLALFSTFSAVLGPFGAYLVETFGAGGAAGLLIASFAFWIVVPLGVARWILTSRDL